MSEKRKRAIAIVELFDEFLSEHGIRIFSEDDDQRDEINNDVSLYGMTFWSLVSEVEDELERD